MNRLFRILLASCLLILSGCSLISQYRDAAALKVGYQRKVVAESLVEQVKKEFDAKLAANAADQETKQAAATNGLKDEIQSAANSLYAAHLAAILNPHPDRTHLVVDNKVTEAQAALKVPPTIEAMTAANAEIKRLLDETQTSLEQLKAEHEKDMGEAKQVADRATKAEQDLAAAKQAKIDIEKAKAAELAIKQADLDKVNNAVIAAEHARGDDAKARQATLEKLSWAAGVLAALCFAGAVFSPICKMELGAFGAIMAVGAVGIWYLTPVVVLVIVLAVVAVIIGKMVYSHNVANKTNTALVNAVQDVKDKAPEVYAATVKPALTAWTTKYAKDATGATVAVPDASVTANIDAHLVAANRV